jgi:hypothetical protein
MSDGGDLELARGFFLWNDDNYEFMRGIFLRVKVKFFKGSIFVGFKVMFHILVKF